MQEIFLSSICWQEENYFFHPGIQASLGNPGQMINSFISMYLQMISAGKTWLSSLPEWALHFDVALGTAKITLW